jgi:nitroreductase
VRDPSIKKRLEDTLGKPNSAAKSLLEAPLALVLCGKQASAGYYGGEVKTRWGDWILFDCGLAAQNLSLMAHSLGLGSVIIGQFDHQAVEKILAVPDGFSVVCMIPLGYPAKTPQAPERKHVPAFTHMETFRA